MANHLYYGDNLEVLRAHIKDESVDLVYLDPPFNSNATYNVLFRSPAGIASQAQIEAFEDTWQWNNQAETAFDEVMQGRNADVANMLRAMRSFLKENDMMAYLTHMAVRLVELHRVLKPAGSIYLHCDPTASHYLKLLMDAVFGKESFVNQLTWKRSHAHSDARQGSSHYGRISDQILFYSKGDERNWNVQFTPYSQEYIDRDYRRTDADGRRYRLDNIQGPGGAEKGNPYYEVMGVSRYWRYSEKRMKELIDQGLIVQTQPGTVPQLKRYLDEMPGVPLQDIWTDIQIINNRSKEILGYPTQKPVALLERILSASSNPGDVVLDPFCGCGTTVHAAEKLGRQWIGIDITHLSVSLIERRLKDAFPGIAFEVHGRPKDLDGAKDLAARDKHDFQIWATTQINNAQPFRSGKKGADGGIDGHIFFRSGAKSHEKAIISIKGGGVGVKDIRELIAVVDRERAKIGIYVTLEAPTGPMLKEAAGAGLYDGPTGKVPKIQIVTIEDLFAGKQPKVPLPERGLKAAAREARDDQSEFDI